VASLALFPRPENKKAMVSACLSMAWFKLAGILLFTERRADRSDKVIKPVPTLGKSSQTAHIAYTLPEFKNTRPYSGRVEITRFSYCQEKILQPVASVSVNLQSSHKKPAGTSH
jgi:hypothetical protein